MLQAAIGYLGSFAGASSKPKPSEESVKLGGFFQECGKVIFFILLQGCSNFFFQFGFFTSERLFEAEDCERGYAPRLTPNYHNAIHSKHEERGMSGLKPDVFGTSWSLQCDQFWNETHGVLRPLFDVDWGRPGSSERAYISTIPLKFSQSEETEEKWVLIEGETIGTCFRSSHQVSPHSACTLESSTISPLRFLLYAKKRFDLFFIILHFPKKLFQPVGTKKSETTKLRCHQKTCGRSQ